MGTNIVQPEYSLTNFIPSANDWSLFYDQLNLLWVPSATQWTISKWWTIPPLTQSVGIFIPAQVSVLHGSICAKASCPPQWDGSTSAAISSVASRSTHFRVFVLVPPPHVCEQAAVLFHGVNADHSKEDVLYIFCFYRGCFMLENVRFWTAYVFSCAS